MNPNLFVFYSSEQLEIEQFAIAMKNKILSSKTDKIHKNYKMLKEIKDELHKWREILIAVDWKTWCCQEFTCELLIYVNYNANNNPN